MVLLLAVVVVAVEVVTSGGTATIGQDMVPGLAPGFCLELLPGWGPGLLCESETVEHRVDFAVLDSLGGDISWCSVPEGMPEIDMVEDMLGSGSDREGGEGLGNENKGYVKRTRARLYKVREQGLARVEWLYVTIIT